jgi:hypothetical protein
MAASSIRITLDDEMVARAAAAANRGIPASSAGFYGLRDACAT